MLRVKPNITITVIAFIAGFLLAVVVFDIFQIFKNKSDERNNLTIREYDERYEFIRPLLICQINEQEEDKELKMLKKQVEKVITLATIDGDIDSGSVYFRDLNLGRWMGVNEKKDYSPASLLKVPTMMAYFREARGNTDLLEKRYQYIKNDNYINQLIDKPLLKDGESYTINELIKAMIVQSDNSAKDILIHNANQSILKNIYSVLGIATPYDLSSEDYKISTKDYALFFRVLYNSTFLGRNMSNNALRLLSEVQFDKGLRAGTPSGIKVAHKYGVRVTPSEAVSDQNGKSAYIDKAHIDKTGAKVELSDCGIIYNGSSPYLLCVMVSGKDSYTLADVIKHIAETVYGYQSRVE